MSEAGRPGDEGSGLERWLRPYLSDSTLWPVTFVAVVVLVLFGATLVLLAARERNLFAAAALLGLAWISADGVRASRRAGRVGTLGRAIVALWALVALSAAAAIVLGLF
jgi:hypothetical protein